MICYKGTIKYWISIFLGSVILLNQYSHAAVEFRKGIILRDSECEKILKSYIIPIFKTAGLDPSRLHFFLVHDPELNAFATTRHTIVLHSGLIQKAGSPEEVIGVLAHETGHIAAGHIARMEEAMKKSSAMGMVAVATGILAGIATGRGDLGTALAMGGMDSSLRNILHYSRGQEAAADQAALRYLHDLQWPSTGLLTFMETIHQQELLSSGNQDPWYRTHPMSSERMNFMKTALGKAPPHASLPENFRENFKVLKAKLDGYLDPPGKTFLKYSERDKSFHARYARMIAFYRDNQTATALQKLEELIADKPLNPFLHELKGQILYENGKINGAIEAFKKALKLAPEEPLIMIMMAQCLAESSKPEDLALSRNLLEKALIQEDENPFPWRLLATVCGKQNDIGIAALYLAEEALRTGSFKIARDQAKRALAHKTSAILRAHDIIRLCEEELKSFQEDGPDRAN